jgi:hypothetical protein
MGGHAPLCRREGINPNLYYRWTKAFWEASCKRLKGDTLRDATSEEVGGLCQEKEQLKTLAVELDLTVVKSRIPGVKIKVKPRLQSDNCPVYEFQKLAEC